MIERRVSCFVLGCTRPEFTERRPMETAQIYECRTHEYETLSPRQGAADPLAIRRLQVEHYWRQCLPELPWEESSTPDGVRRSARSRLTVTVAHVAKVNQFALLTANCRCSSMHDQTLLLLLISLSSSARISPIGQSHAMCTQIGVRRLRHIVDPFRRQHLACHADPTTLPWFPPPPHFRVPVQEDPISRSNRSLSVQRTTALLVQHDVQIRMRYGLAARARRPR